MGEASNDMLLTREQAKTYLGGLDPHRVASPLALGVERRWDRREIDRKIDEMAGYVRAEPPPPPEPDCHCTIYFVQGELSRLIKIGRTFDFRKRLSTMQTGSGEELRTLLMLWGPPRWEDWAHEQLAAHRVRGEWFTPHQDVLDAIARWRTDERIAQ